MLNKWKMLLDVLQQVFLTIRRSAGSFRCLLLEFARFEVLHAFPVTFVRRMHSFSAGAITPK